MKPRNPLTPEQRAKISAGTKAAMASPEMRALISKRTKAGMAAASPKLAELRILRDVWQRTRPDARQQFLNEILASVCSASSATAQERADDDAGVS